MATMTKRKKRGPKRGRPKAIAGALALAKLVAKLPDSTLYIDYDAEADVLYVSLKRPQNATHTEEVEDQGVLLDYRKDELVGITVLDASTR